MKYDKHKFLEMKKNYKIKFHSKFIWSSSLRFTFTINDKASDKFFDSSQEMYEWVYRKYALREEVQ